MGMFQNFATYEEYSKKDGYSPPSNLEEWKHTLKEEDRKQYEDTFET